MKNEMKITGVTKITAKLKEYQKKSRAAAEQGMGLAMMALQRDCIMETPTVPIDEGTLRGSGSIFVGNKLIGTSESLSKKSGTPNRDYSFTGNGIVGTVGFNTPYAARWHETDANFRETSSGKWYLIDKMKRFKNDYMKIIADVIKAVR